MTHETLGNLLLFIHFCCCSRCVRACVCVLFLLMPLVGMWPVIVTFPGHIHFFLFCCCFHNVIDQDAGPGNVV